MNRSKRVKNILFLFIKGAGWSDGAKVLGKPPVPGRSTYLDNSRSRPIALAVGASCLDIFFSRLSFLYSFSLSKRRLDID